MPKYDKFMKGLLSKKGKEEETSKINLNERCSPVLLNKIPLKEKDPGSFTIQFVVGKIDIDKALADLEASINLMSYSMGIVENVIVKIDKFIFRVDFVVLDMEEDHKILIILGRPFLATTQEPNDFIKPTLFAVNTSEAEAQLPKLKELPSHLELWNFVLFGLVECYLEEIQKVDQIAYQRAIILSVSKLPLPLSAKAMVFLRDVLIMTMEVSEHFFHMKPSIDAVIQVKQKQLNLGVVTERMIFNIDSAMKHSYSNDDTCFSIDVIDEILEEDFDALLDEV
nr:hypothetical protein [Tanacetum cinerariifolium]